MFAIKTGTRYVFTESDLPEGFQKYGSSRSTAFSPTFLKNYPVQGFAGELVQIMIGLLWRHFVMNDNYGGQALLTNTVHDCIWVDAKTPEVARAAAYDAKRIMSNVREMLNRHWPEMKCEVDFPCDVVAGHNMGKTKPLAVVFPEQPAKKSA